MFLSSPGTNVKSRPAALVLDLSGGIAGGAPVGDRPVGGAGAMWHPGHRLVKAPALCKKRGDLAGSSRLAAGCPGAGWDMTEDNTTLSKRDALESLLGHGDVLIQLDPRVAGVDVPPDLHDQALLVLRIGLDMPVPIPDLSITNTGIRATLSFNRQPYCVDVPWRAVFGMVSEGGQGLLWTRDVPDEVMQQMRELRDRASVQGDAPPGAPQTAPGPRLVALDGGRPAEAPAPGPSESRPGAHLRLIK